MKKLILLLSFCLSLILTGCDFVWPEEKVSLNKWEYNTCSLIIDDSIGIMTDDEEAIIKDRLESYCKQAKYDVVFITCNESKNGTSTKTIDYADKYGIRREYIVIKWNALRREQSCYVSGIYVAAAMECVNSNSILSSGDYDYKNKDYHKMLASIGENLMREINNNWYAIYH